MDKIQSIEALSALSQETRLDVFRLLTQSEPQGLCVNEIADAMGARQNTISTNLAILARAGLIRSRREGRSVRYFANVDGMRDLLSFLMEDCCDGGPETCLPLPARARTVLFLCSANSARSIMAEAILNRWGQGRFRACSAGARPAGAIHPVARDLLQRQRFDLRGTRSKSWAEFAGPQAPALDFVITLCDAAAVESCPAWAGQPMAAHWGLPDPAAAEGTEAEKRLAFEETFRILNILLAVFVSLPLASLDRLSLQTRLDAIGADRAVLIAPSNRDPGIAAGASQ